MDSLEQRERKIEVGIIYSIAISFSFYLQITCFEVLERMQY
jgi:hypothetical protein